MRRHRGRGPQRDRRVRHDAGRLDGDDVPTSAQHRQRKGCLGQGEPVTDALAGREPEREVDTAGDDLVGEVSGVIDPAVGPEVLGVGPEAGITVHRERSGQDRCPFRHDDPATTMSVAAIRSSSQAGGRSRRTSASTARVRGRAGTSAMSGSPSRSSHSCMTHTFHSGLVNSSSQVQVSSMAVVSCPARSSVRASSRSSSSVSIAPVCGSVAVISMLIMSPAAVPAASAARFSVTSCATTSSIWSTAEVRVRRGALG